MVTMLHHIIIQHDNSMIRRQNKNIPVIVHQADKRAENRLYRLRAISPVNWVVLVVNVPGFQHTSPSTPAFTCRGVSVTILCRLLVLLKAFILQDNDLLMWPT